MLCLDEYILRDEVRTHREMNIGGLKCATIFSKIYLMGAYNLVDLIITGVDTRIMVLTAV
jgi:hypothetical protein